MDNHYKIFQESTASNLLLATIIYHEILNSEIDIWEKGTLQFNAKDGFEHLEPNPKLRNTVELDCIKYPLEQIFEDELYKEVLVSVLAGSKKTEEAKAKARGFIEHVLFKVSDLYLHFYTAKGYSYSNKNLSFGVSFNPRLEGGSRYDLHIGLAAPLDVYNKISSPIDMDKFLKENSRTLIHEIIHTIDHIRAFYLQDSGHFARTANPASSDNEEERKIAYYSLPSEIRAYTYSLIRLLQDYIDKQPSPYKLDPKDFQSAEAFKNFFIHNVREELSKYNQTIDDQSYNSMFAYMPGEEQKKMVKKIADYFINRGLIS